MIRVGPQGNIHPEVRRFSLDEVAKKNLFQKAMNDKAAYGKYMQWKQELEILKERSTFGVFEIKYYR